MVLESGSFLSGKIRAEKLYKKNRETVLEGNKIFEIWLRWCEGVLSMSSYSGAPYFSSQDTDLHLRTHEETRR